MSGRGGSLGQPGAGRVTTSGEYIYLLAGGAVPEAAPGATEVGPGRGPLPRPGPPTRLECGPDGADGSALDSEVGMARGPLPSTVWFDKYELTRAVRKEALTASEAWLLTFLLLEVDWRADGRCFVGHQQELVQQTMLPTKAVRSALARLEGLGWVRLDRPFTNYEAGVVRVLCYERFVRLSGERRGRLEEADEGGVKDEWSEGEVEVMADPPSRTPLDQPFRAETLRTHVEKDAGVSRVPLTRDGPALGSFLRALPRREVS